jgi:protein phosphatase
MTLTAEEKLLTQARDRLPELSALSDRTSQRLVAMQSYVREYRRYCWPVNSIDDLKLAPFHLLASKGAVHTDKPRTWHMETLTEFCAADTKLLLATSYRLVDLNDPASCESAIA